MESTKFAQTLKFFESDELSTASKKIMVESRKRFDSINESRLSLAEPNPILNKSF